jgi:O-acetyl-ADP-ribose deacetylase (regulator of RNase III)
LGRTNVRVIQGRFEALEPHDCFVTAGNAFGLMTAGIDAAVVRFFGEGLMHNIQHRIMDQFLGEQPVGTAFIEPTGNPDCPFVAHAPTMRMPRSIDGTDKVCSATWAALLAVHTHNVISDRKIETVAFPALGTGFGGVPFDEAARQMAGVSALSQSTASPRLGLCDRAPKKYHLRWRQTSGEVSAGPALRPDSKPILDSRSRSTRSMA